MAVQPSRWHHSHMPLLLVPCDLWPCHSGIVPIHSRAIQALLVTGGYSSSPILTLPGAFVAPHLPRYHLPPGTTCTAPLTGMGDPGRAAAEDLSLTHTHCTVVQSSVLHSVETSDLQVAPSDVHSGIIGGEGLQAVFWWSVGLSGNFRE